MDGKRETEQEGPAKARCSENAGEKPSEEVFIQGFRVGLRNHGPRHHT